MIAGLLVCAALGAGPRPAIVSTDLGAEVDDQWALAHLAASPGVDLRGVVTSHAPGLAPAEAARRARALLDLIPGTGPIPVVAGSAAPLPPGDRPLRNAGVDLLLAAARDRRADDRLAVVVIGAATDVASALRIDPSWADRVEVIAMAFDGWPGGGDPWNVKNDVRAWRELMASRVPLVVGDAAVTARHLAMTPAKARALLGGSGPAGAALRADLDAWLARSGPLVERTTGRRDAWILWDEVTTAHLLGMTTVEARPRPRLRDDRTLDHAGPRGTIGWITAIDADRLWADLAGRLAPRPAP